MQRDHVRMRIAWDAARWSQLAAVYALCSRVAGGVCGLAATGAGKTERCGWSRVGEVGATEAPQRIQYRVERGVLCFCRQAGEAGCWAEWGGVEAGNGGEQGQKRRVPGGSGGRGLRTLGS